MWLGGESRNTTEISSGEKISVLESSLSVMVLCRKFLGPELVIVILTMPSKSRKKRLKQRHPKKEDKEAVEVLMVILVIVSCY